MSEEQKKSALNLTFSDKESLERFTTETGKILPRKFTGLTAKEQRHVKKSIKQSRNMLLMK